MILNSVMAIMSCYGANYIKVAKDKPILSAAKNVVQKSSF